MKKFKRFFAVFVFEYPKTSGALFLLSFLFVLISIVTFYNGFESKNLALSLSGAGGTVLFVVFFILFFSAEKWFVILQAQEVLKNNSRFTTLKEIILKVQKKNNDVKFLKNWLKDFKECNNLREYYNSLRDESVKLIQKINEVETEKNTTEEKMGIDDLRKKSAKLIQEINNLGIKITSMEQKLGIGDYCDNDGMC